MTPAVETTAAMTPQAEQHDPAGAGVGSPAPEAVASVAAEQAAGRRELSTNFVITLFGGLITTLLGGLIGLMLWQFSSLGDRIDSQSARIDSNSDRIDSLGDRIDSLGADLRAEMRNMASALRAEMDDLEAALRAEMRAGFAEINAVLLDHTDQQGL